MLGYFFMSIIINKSINFKIFYAIINLTEPLHVYLHADHGEGFWYIKKIFYGIKAYFNLKMTKKPLITKVRIAKEATALHK